MTGIGKTDMKKHDRAVCEGCRFWNSGMDWCDYGRMMRRSRLASGGSLLPEGGCRLYEAMEPGDDTRRTFREQWGAGKNLRTGKRIGESLPDSVFRQMELLYGEGKTDSEIAEELGVGKSSVGRWRTRNCLESNYTKKLRAAKGQA